MMAFGVECPIGFAAIYAHNHKRFNALADHEDA
jgi:hypothetical protein